MHLQVWVTLSSTMRDVCSLLLVSLLLSPAAAAYATLFSRTGPTSLFSATGLSTHSTGLRDDLEAQCPAPELPTRLDVAAPPRALPKRSASDGDDESRADPLGLWTPPTAPGGPQGPNIYKLNQVRACTPSSLLP